MVCPVAAASGRYSGVRFFRGRKQMTHRIAKRLALAFAVRCSPAKMSRPQRRPPSAAGVRTVARIIIPHGGRLPSRLTGVRSQLSHREVNSRLLCRVGTGKHRLLQQRKWVGHRFQLGSGPESRDDHVRGSWGPQLHHFVPGSATALTDVRAAKGCARFRRS